MLSFNFMPKVTVLNVTSKPGGIDVLKDNLDKQSFTDFEVVIVDKLHGWRHKEVAKAFKDSPYPVYHIPEPMGAPTDAWNLNKAYNAGLRDAKGELVVSLQDYIWIKGTGIEQFVDIYEDYGPKVAICGVGNKALYPNKADDRNGKLSIWKTPFTGKPEGISEADHRYDGKQTLEDIPHSLFELNWAAIPLQGLKEIGGFDERYDQGFSCDNFNLSFRLSLIDYAFLLDKTNECIGFNQRDIFPRPVDWEKRHNRYQRHPTIIRAIIEKRESYKLNHL